MTDSLVLLKRLDIGELDPAQAIATFEQQEPVDDRRRVVISAVHLYGLSDSRFDHAMTRDVWIDIDLLVRRGIGGWRGMDSTAIVVAPEGDKLPTCWYSVAPQTVRIS